MSQLIRFGCLQSFYTDRSGSIGYGGHHNSGRNPEGVDCDRLDTGHFDFV